MNNEIPGNEVADGGGDPTPVVASVEEYAIVEIMGHRTIIGRITEVMRFGGTLMSIEPIYRGELLPAVLINAASIYQFTPCSEAVAKAQAPKSTWDLPPSVRFSIPVHLLEAADAVLPFLHDDGDDREEEPF